MTNTPETPLGSKPLAIITGAGGGMGRACARRLANTHALVLTDFNQQRLSTLADALREEDNAQIAATICGDIADQGIINQICAAAGQDGSCKVLVHTAGLSPALAGWRQIMRANLVGTAKLLEGIKAVLTPGFAGIVLSSTARCFAPPPGKALSELLAHPLTPDLLDSLEPHLGNDDETRAANAYAWSKRWVHDTVMQLASDWARSGARIASISPGFILTGMTRIEVDQRPEMLDLLKATPLGRWGTVNDIADTVEFLLSAKASFITGTDIVIDGGLSAHMLTTA